MKKRRKFTSNVDDKVRCDRQKESSAKILLAVSEQETVVDSAGVAATDELACSKEFPPSQDQRELLSSLQYNRNLLKYLNNDRQKQPSFCDLLIIVDGKEFSAHKVVVAVGSSYFHAYLSKNPRTDVITLDHVTHSVFRHLLEFLYTSEFFVYKKEIPLVLEAAKFLDIIDAVKLLNGENVPNSQSEERTESPSQVQMSSELTHKAASHHQCALCNRNFCYKKSFENHLFRAHKSFTQEEEEDGLKMVERTEISTRRSMRNRKCPAKFEQSDNESEESSDSCLDKDAPGKENSESEDSGSEYNTDDGRKEEDTSGDDTGSEEQSEKEHEEEEDGQELDSLAENTSESTLSTYIPLIVQNSNKKCLQCPKCDKTFDRAGKRQYFFDSLAV